MIRPDIQVIIDDMINNVIPNWSEEDQDYFYLNPYKGEETLTSFHMSLGMWIRNHYKLWSYKWEPEMKEYMGCMCDCSPYHPDQLSNTILEEVWKKGR